MSYQREQNHRKAMLNYVIWVEVLATYYANNYQRELFLSEVRIMICLQKQIEKFPLKVEFKGNNC